MWAHLFCSFTYFWNGRGLYYWNPAAVKFEICVFSNSFVLLHMKFSHNVSTENTSQDYFYVDAFNCAWVWVNAFTLTRSSGNCPLEFSGTLMGGITQSLFTRRRVPSPLDTTLRHGIKISGTCSASVASLGFICKDSKRESWHSAYLSFVHL